MDFRREQESFRQVKHNLLSNLIIFGLTEPVRMF